MRRMSRIVAQPSPRAMPARKLRQIVGQSLVWDLSNSRKGSFAFSMKKLFDVGGGIDIPNILAPLAHELIAHVFAVEFEHVI